MIYTQMQDGTVVARDVTLEEPWWRKWRCEPGRCWSEPDAPCPCRGPVTAGHDPGDEDVRR